METIERVGGSQPGIVMSGTVLGIQRQTPDTIKITLRDTTGLVYETQFPFSQERSQTSLPFNIDDMVKINIQVLPK